MKAFVHARYGPPEVLQMMEVGKPVPTADEVLVKVRAAALNKSDLIMLTGKPFLVRLMTMGQKKGKYRLVGSDLAGVVESVGPDVRRLRPGDEVFGNLSVQHLGSCAEYASTAEDSLALKPANLSFEEAAAVPQAAMTALQGLRDVGRIGPGKKVLIHGASGGVGTFAVQIARALGGEVSAVTSPRHLETARQLGAGQVFDYTKEDFTRSGQKYDLIFVANGSRSIFDYKRALSPGGVCAVSGGSMRQFAEAGLLGPFASRGDKKISLVSEKNSRQDLNILKEMLEEGKVVPVIDRTYPLSDLPKAMAYLGEGHSSGKIALTVP